MRTTRMSAKTMNKIIFVAVLALAGISFSACSGDNEGGNEGGTNGNLITILKSNKWYCDTDFSYDGGDDDHIWADSESTTLYFTSDKNGVLYWIQKDYDSELGNNITTDYTYFTYKISGNNVILEYEDGSTYTYRYKNNRLVYNNTDFYQSPLNYGDKDLIKRISPQTGSCGSSLNYAYYPKTHILEITGKGEMRDFTSKSQPWHDCYIEEVRIEEGCTSIGNLAFYESQYLTTVELPKTLKSIGTGSFAGSSITKVIIPNNVFYIKEGAFENCQYLKSVILGDGIEEIGDYAFCNCPVTTYLTLPENVTKVGAYAFMGWKLSGLTLNEKLKIIGNAAFYVKAKTISIPNSVESIGNLAFTGTFSNVTIGTGLKTLSRNAFDGSESGGNIYVNLGIPLKIADDGGVFANNQSKWKLYVPKGSIVAYKQSKSWNSFSNITEDASLVSGNGMPDENDGNDDNDDELTGIILGHEYVDLGLSVKWATCNIGAKEPEETGTYYCWGRTTEEWNIPYPADVEYMNICGTGNDVASVLWGKKWKLPTQKQFQELIDNCTFSLKKQNGVFVAVVKSKKNGQSIVFPFTGMKEAFYDPTTDFKFNHKGEVCYCMIGESYLNKGSVDPRTPVFEIWKKDMSADFTRYNNATRIFCWVYKLPVRPVSN